MNSLLITVFLLLSAGGQARGLEEGANGVDQGGDVTFTCERYNDGERFHVHCDFTDNRRYNDDDDDDDDFCSSNSFLPHFERISIRCALSLMFSDSECRIVELTDEGTEGATLVSIDARIFLNRMEQYRSFWDIPLNFESIFPGALSLGKALLRCRTGGFQENDKLTCSLFGVGSGASAAGDFSCSLISSSNTDDLVVNLVQCGFSERHSTAGHRGNLTVFTKNYRTSSTTDVLFAVRSSDSPSKSVMKTPRVDCHLMGDDAESPLSCAVHLNEDILCERKETDKEEEEEEEEEKDDEQEEEEEEEERDLFTELDRTIEVDLEEIEVGRAKFNCYQAKDMTTYITRCSLNYSEGHLAIDQDSLVEVAMHEDKVFIIDGAHLISLVFADKSLFKGAIFEMCEVMGATDGGTDVVCDVKVDRKVTDQLWCNITEARPEGHQTKQFVACHMDLLGYSFDGTFVNSLASPEDFQFTVEGDLKSFKNNRSSFQFKSTCTISGYEHVKVNCKLSRKDLV